MDEAAGTTDLGFNAFTVRPGERIPWAYHYHPEHEELFYVVTGEVTFETDDSTFRIGKDEAFYVPPGAPQKCFTSGTEDTRLVAVGEPKRAANGVITERCSVCGGTTGRYKEVLESDGCREYALHCPECDERIDGFGAGPDDNE